MLEIAGECWRALESAGDRWRTVPCTIFPTVEDVPQPWNPSLPGPGFLYNGDSSTQHHNGIVLWFVARAVGGILVRSPQPSRIEIEQDPQSDS